MRGLALVLALIGVASASEAQVMTNCNQVGMFANCTSTGPGGMSTTDCSRTGAFVNCQTMGNAYAQPDQAPTTTNDGAAASAGAAVAAAGLGLLIWKGAQAVHEKRERDRAQRVAALMVVHDCEGAAALANRENDGAMAARVPSICKTRAQAGEDPAFLAEAAPLPQVLAWTKTNIRPVPGGIVLDAVRDEFTITQPSAAPAGSLWLHQEVLSADGEREMHGRSKLMLVGFDCAQSTFAIKSSTLYAGQNLTGSIQSDDQAGPFIPVRPGSRAEAWSKRACSRPAPVLATYSSPTGVSPNSAMMRGSPQ